MEKINYQIVLDKKLKEISEKGKKPSLMLHACCAPCSSYVLEYLSDYFKIKILFYNPNISPEEEFLFRYDELKRLICELRLDIEIIKGKYEPEKFYELARGLEKLPEDSERCYKCYELRSREAAKLAKKFDFDYFTTTLSISPHKNAARLNEIGKKLADEYGINYLFSDFKKKNGYKRSCELSEIYRLYRQNYCGCVYSKKSEKEEPSR